MIANTRSAAMTPSSISFVSSEASATEWIGTLRTSMALGMDVPLGSIGYDDGADRLAVGESGHGTSDAGQVRDDAGASGLLDEAADGVHLRPHRAAGEVARGGVLPHLVEGDATDVLGLRGPVAQDGVRDVGGDDQRIG